MHSTDLQFFLIIFINSYSGPFLSYYVLVLLIDLHSFCSLLEKIPLCPVQTLIKDSTFTVLGWLHIRVICRNNSKNESRICCLPL